MAVDHALALDGSLNWRLICAHKPGEFYSAEPSDDDELLGLMETDGIAASVVEDHNKWCGDPPDDAASGRRPE